MAELRWETRTVGLRFMLGEVPLGKATFRMRRLENHFMNLDADLDDSRFEAPELWQGCQGVHVRSHPLQRPLRRIQRLPWAIRYVPCTYQHFYTNLTGSFDDYLKSHTRDSRRNVQRRIRRFQEFCGGVLDVREYRREDEIDEFFALAGEVSGKTYQENLLHVGMPRDGDYLERLRDQGRRDAFRGHLLFHDGKPIAFTSARVEDDVVLGQFLGYDPAYAKWSPGMTLEYCRMERLFAEGVYRLLDYGSGESHYKQFFSTDSVRCGDLYYFRPSLKTRAIVRLHSGCDRFSGGVGALLQKTGAKTGFKKLLRRKTA